MRALVEYLAKSVVDYPDEVTVDEYRRGDRTVIRVRVAQDDMGKVIGRDGRVANAIRTMMKVASVSDGRTATLEIR